MSYLLFDIGGTRTRVAISDDLRTLRDVQSFNTPKKAIDGIDKIVEIAKKQIKGDVKAIAGGIRGQLNDDNTELAVDTKLTGWVEEPLVTVLEKKLKTKVFLENDAAIAGLGEAHFGAGKGAEIVVYHTVSTGVGGAKIEDGEIDDARTGFEPGHQILDIDHTILGEDIEPTLENLVSGNAIEARMGIKPYEISQDDTLWDQLAFYLAHGLRNSILYWSPDVIVLGGSMILGDPRILLDDIIKHTNEVMGEVTEVPLIVDSVLGDEVGLYGAMALLDQRQ